MSGGSDAFKACRPLMMLAVLLLASILCFLPGPVDATVDAPDIIPGDLDGNGIVDSSDCIYLLYSIFFPSFYPLDQSADFNGDGIVNTDDVLYLLYHISFPDEYPLMTVNSITFVLDGGTLSDAPNEYVPGTQLQLSDPVKEDCLFGGWYLDPDFSLSFAGDTTGLKGPITLYPRWDESLVGHTITLTKSGYNNRGYNAYTIEGDLTFTYLCYDPERRSYFVRNTDNSTYHYPNMGITQTVSSSNVYWGDEIEGEWTDLGTETIDTVKGSKECSVFRLDHPGGGYEIQWTADGWIVYKIVYYQQFSGSLYQRDAMITYTYASDGYVAIEKECDIELFQGKGVEVQGFKGTYRLGERAVMTATVADGTEFGGWYDENFKLLSDETTFSYLIGGSQTIYALGADLRDAEFVSDEYVDLNLEGKLTDATYVVTNIDTGVQERSESDMFMFRDGGRYIVRATSADANRLYIVKVSGMVDRSFEWMYIGERYSLTLGIDYDDLLYARAYYGLDERHADSYHVRDRSFVTLGYTDAVMAPYTERLSYMLLALLGERHPGFNVTEMLDYLLRFTQYIGYQSDEEYMGMVEYWKFPLETLYDQGGDCEDTSILYCALANKCKDILRSDYKVALVLLPGHMAAAVFLEGSNRYTYCETTNTRFELGQIPGSMAYYYSNILYRTILEIR